MRWLGRGIIDWVALRREIGERRRRGCKFIGCVSVCIAVR